MSNKVVKEYLGKIVLLLRFVSTFRPEMPRNMRDVSSPVAAAVDFRQVRGPVPVCVSGRKKKRDEFEALLI